MTPDQVVGVMFLVLALFAFVASVRITLTDRRDEQRLDHEDSAMRLGNAGRES